MTTTLRPAAVHTRPPSADDRPEPPHLSELPRPPEPPRAHWLLRALAAGSAFAATPFGAPVLPHTIAELLRPETRR